MRGLPEHPATPPLWIGAWPDAATVRGLFSEGIRRYAHRVLRDADTVPLDWDDRRLVLDLVHQEARWSLTGSEWRTSCTCGFPGGRCAHAYAAARVFQQVLEHENWLHRGGPPPKSELPVSGAWRKRMKATAPALEQLPLFGSVIPSPETATPARIEAEVDLHFSPGRVALRFYLNENEQRSLLRMQQLLNLALASAHSTASRRRWSEDDLEFFEWLAPQLRRDRQLRGNLQVLKLSESDFRFWLDRWDSHPGRFIERSTQQPILRGERAARLHFELENEREWVRIHAVIRAPNGQRRLFHEVFDDLATGRKQVVVEGKLLDFDPPIPMDLLFEVFGRRSPRMRKEHVQEHLPALLKYRLDLVRGEKVARRDRTGRLRILTSADGAGIRLRLFIDSTAVRPEVGGAPAGIVLRNDEFCIIRRTSPDLAPVRRALAKLPMRIQPDAAFLLEPTPENVGKLAEIWPTLPGSVALDICPELSGILDNDAPLRPEMQVEDHGPFVDMSVVWGNGELSVSNAEARTALRSESGIFRSRSGRWLRLDTEAAASAWLGLGAANFDADRLQRVFRPRARELLQTFSEQNAVSTAPGSEPLVDRLLTEPIPEPLSVPAAVEPVLRNYQTAGFHFLADRLAHRIGPILADDMGLGKTIQVLALLSAWTARRADEAPIRKPAARGALVVCPASVISVWLEQAGQFTPELRCQTYTGPPADRQSVLDRGDWDVLVTNYALVRNDISLFTQYTFGLVVLDEAQQIKNRDSRISRAVKSLRASHPLALTGTPLENRIGDIWSVMEFLNPGYLGPFEDFLARYDSQRGRLDLARKIAPVMLRRDKASVAPELPPKTEETLHIDLAEEQERVYAELLTRARQTAHGQGAMQILAALTRLRQVCCDPSLVPDHEDDDLPSAKLEVLLDMLEELVAEGHSVLVFSQFTSMLDIMEKALEHAGTPFLKLTGETAKARRAELVRQFNEAENPHVFLLSLRAAGTGLNLTRAEYVFIYDPWWNPAVERQAIDRAHRIGQQQPVIAYRLVARGTVEERVLELQRTKAELFEEVVDGAARTGGPGRLTAKDLAALLA